jgi:hypothetical protein
METYLSFLAGEAAFRLSVISVETGIQFFELFELIEFVELNSI